MAPPRRTYHVEPLGGDKYKLITTVTVERTVTEAELVSLGLMEARAPEVPWAEAPVSVAPVRREQGTRERVVSPFAAAMTAWRELGMPIDRRMMDLVPVWLDQFKLEGVLRAMNEAATGPGVGSPYQRLVHVIRRMTREQRGEE